MCKLCEVLKVTHGEAFMADGEKCIVFNDVFNIITKGREAMSTYKLSLLQSIINGEIDVEPIKKLTREEVEFASFLYQYTDFRFVTRTAYGTVLKNDDITSKVPGTKVYCFNNYLDIGETAALIDLADLAGAEEEEDGF